jgi:hypothetical protein
MLDANFRELWIGEVRRIPLPRTPVHKGKEKGPGPKVRDPGLLTPPPSLEENGVLPSAIAGCYFGLITPQVAGIVAS